VVLILPTLNTPRTVDIEPSAISRFVDTLSLQATAMGQQWLFCPDFRELSGTELSTASLYLYEMQDALENSDAKAFNFHKKALVLLLKQCHYKIAPWQLLELWVEDEQCLARTDFSLFDLSLVRLKTQQPNPVSLVKARFCGALLSHADFSGFNLSGADFTGATLRYSWLEHARLQNTCLLKADLSYARLSHANLEGANLYMASLKEAMARHAVFNHACINSASLSMMDGFGIQLRHTDLKNSDCQEVSWFMGDLSHASLCNSNLKNANLLFANLQDVDWAGAKTQGARTDRRQSPE
jgi:uncharacterized protein YjbI with pentapeptide repeats